jgi:lambda family phage portal protein
MGIASFFGGLFGRKNPVRSYGDLASQGGVNSDWSTNAQSQDSQIWQNNAKIRQRLRDLFDGTAFFRKYREQLISNVFGDCGIRLRMKIKEEADKVVYMEDEKNLHLANLERMERIADYAARKIGVQRTKSMFARFDRASGTVKAGALDLYANQLIERKWQEWQDAKYATMTGRFSYGEVRHLRMIAAARDGDFFIRLIRDPRPAKENSVNKFGFSLQLIHAEWCDYNFNRVRKGDQNEIRMGVELNEWQRPVAYHFIKRQPGDWQYAPPGGFFMSQGESHTRVPAEEIIHYARMDYADSTRPAGWGVAGIPVARHLSKYVEAAVIAARAGACQSGFFYSDVTPEGGGVDPAQLPNPCQFANEYAMAPGVIKGLPYGVKYQANNPNNPNSQFGPFRKDTYRELAACVPGGNYNILANDSEGISYSTGRIFSLDDREMWKVLQRFDIDKAERPIFVAWLEMALSTGELPLRLSRFQKYNKPVFTGRRWAWVDPSKDELKNLLTSWARIFDEKGEDLEEVWLERAEEAMLAEELNLKLPTFGEVAAMEPEDGEEPEGEETPGAGKNGKTNGRQVSLAVN